MPCINGCSNTDGLPDGRQCSTCGLKAYLATFGDSKGLAALLHCLVICASCARSMKIIGSFCPGASAMTSMTCSCGENGQLCFFYSSVRRVLTHATLDWIALDVSSILSSVNTKSKSSSSSTISSSAPAASHDDRSVPPPPPHDLASLYNKYYKKKIEERSSAETKTKGTDELPAAHPTSSMAQPRKRARQ
ncbi:hypothetical protein L198_00021 [Cryptococcus wingfieldii CBS 7118]|uniref:Uncharacterized protein n=1 Tax=Cryptococcus wingfieldii CBS 7118 TaxID=1295528 RepID=A0A1E3K518_9TREE|nr:hypothetical protein L198_00021 [Cryptococcus wingfieldii CBS 7118]ODO08298.1 hypothetical protein L198_00021 [Cryptococcus wingfieldii CBS 7118]